MIKPKQFKISIKQSRRECGEAIAIRSAAYTNPECQRVSGLGLCIHPIVKSYYDCWAESRENILPVYLIFGTCMAPITIKSQSLTIFNLFALRALHRELSFPF